MKRYGWQDVERRHFEDGAECHSIEQQLHEALGERLTVLDPPASNLDERTSAAAGNLHGQTEMYPMGMFVDKNIASLDALFLAAD